MLSQTLRRKFLQYFESRKHAVVASSPVFPHDDPTLLFVNAGMNQFKDVFLGQSEREYVRATSSQKCIRVGGKHNDLENVGHTSRHLTFFEMLGNFSFGDYFKEEAIAFAWEVVSEVFGLEGDKIWVSVFREDDEAFELWKRFLPEDRIVRLDERDNFWAMGETGPCGPCSELLFDRGEAFGDAKSPYEDTGGERFFEFWNLVFMEFSRDEKEKMAPLPKRNIDTGMGLERLVALKMGVDNLFETDVLRGLIDKLEELSGVEYEKGNAAFHVVADHMRTLSFSIADGLQPSNLERGYVLRKVLRRAVRYAKGLGMKEPFMGQLLPRLVELMGEDFPELVTNKDRIEEILTGEEEAFFRTLKRGGNLLNQVMANSKKSGAIGGDDAFKLKDTYGLPLEEILLLAKDQELSVDLERYQELELEAKERSKKVHKVVHQKVEEGAFADVGESQFIGYESLEGEGKVIALFVGGKKVEELKEGQEGMIILNKTPFYAEKGGQVGDVGILTAEGSVFEVSDCQNPYTGVIAHIGTLQKGRVGVGDRLLARIDAKRRQRITHNHTATHLLHWALQKVLGPQVKQAGSVVEPDRLRFDFSHHKGLNKEEIRWVEDLVNEKVSENFPVNTQEIPYAEAQKDKEIKQFFGDKYGAQVRVVGVGPAKELCGGNHASMSGEIGTFRITSEGSVAAGVRRIVAVTGPEALAHARGFEDLLEDAATLLKTQPQKLLERVSHLVEENTHYAKEMRQARQKQLHAAAEKLVEEVRQVGKIPFISALVDFDPGELKDLADAILDRADQVVVALGAKAGERCSLVVRVADGWVDEGIKAGDLIKAVAPIIGGGGGGKAPFAQAGGKDPSKLGAALAKLEELLQ